MAWIYTVVMDWYKALRFLQELNPKARPIETHVLRIIRMDMAGSTFFYNALALKLPDWKGKTSPSLGSW